MSTKSHPGDGTHGKGDKGLAAQRGHSAFLRGLLTGLVRLLAIGR